MTRPRNCAARMIGPAIAGGVVAAIGSGYVFLINAFLPRRFGRHLRQAIRRGRKGLGSEADGEEKESECEIAGRNGGCGASHAEDRGGRRQQQDARPRPSRGQKRPGDGAGRHHRRRQFKLAGTDVNTETDMVEMKDRKIQSERASH